MNLISVENISKSYGIKTLFKDICFGIEEGQKIALIGVNGCGKSSLLKILANSRDDNSNIVKRKSLRVSFLEQSLKFNKNDSIIQHILKADTELVSTIREYKECCAENETHTKHFSELSHNMEQLNAWEYESRISSILTQLKIHNLNQKMKTLSGGMLKKVAMAQVLLEESDILILDEPTNHLDINTIQWLEKQLVKSKKTIIMVTHDRYFLDKICNTIFEIDQANLIQYKGNYSYYLEKKAEQSEIDDRREGKIQGLMRLELQWMRKQPQARATKQKARQQQFYRILNRDKPETENDMSIGVAGRRLGKNILNLKKISKQYGENILINSFSYSFSKQNKIGIIGTNGSGKTTLLKIITEQIEADSGTVERGINTHFGYFDQNSSFEDQDQTILNYIKETGQYITLHDGSNLSASQLLERFLFPKSSFNTKISDLSGGEKRRLDLIHILLQNPNFLIFDEPTNDFDIKTLAVLENFLMLFSGCLLVASHDRFFMDRVCDSLFILNEHGGIDLYHGNYTDYLDYQNEKKELELKLKPNSQNQNKTTSKTIKAKTKLSYKEQQEYKKIEDDIEKLETKSKKYETVFSTESYASDKYQEAIKTQQEIQDTLTQKWERWEYLSQFDT